MLLTAAAAEEAEEAAAAAAVEKAEQREGEREGGASDRAESGSAGLTERGRPINAYNRHVFLQTFVI